LWQSISTFIVRFITYHFFLLTIHSHVKVYEGEHNGFIYCCVAIWAFDRFMRLARTIYLGLIPRFFKGIKATATYDDAAEIIRLDVTDLLSNKTITPGYYYYLYAPGDIQGYQSHPFTLCSWRRAISSSTQSSPITTTKEDDKHILPTSSSSSSSSSTSDIVHSLLIRPYRGFTGRLQQKLQSSPDANASTKLTVFLEGPYGNAVDLRSFSDVLIIVGGSGITAAISHSNFLLPTQQTSVHVVWAVQHSHLVDNICDNELKEALNDSKFDLVVYETRKAGADVEKTAPLKGSRPVVHGRPDVEATIRDARGKCGRNLAVVTCGPPRMADACRAAIVAVLGESGPDVEFYNEALGW
jgi:NAD(P)H-flavin reductase